MAVNNQAIFGVVQSEGMEKGFWTRIGTAFQNQDGTWNLRCDDLPTEIFQLLVGLLVLGHRRLPAAARRIRGRASSSSPAASQAGGTWVSLFRHRA